VAGKSFSTSLNYRWVILVVAWLGFVVAYMQRLSVGPLASFLKDGLSLTASQVGLFMSASAFGYMITALPAGWLVDRIGIRWLLLIGEVVGGIFVACMFFVTGLSSGLIFMGLAGLGMGCISPSTTKAVIVWFPVKERATAMGIKQTSVNLGGIITAMTLPTLALTLGWRYGFLGIGIIAIACGIISFVLYKDPPKSPSLHVPIPTAANSNAVTVPSARPSVLEVFKNREIWLVVLCSMFLCVIEFSAAAYFALYLNEALLFAVVAAGFGLALFNAGGAFGKPIVGMISDRVFGGGRKIVLAMLCCIAFVGCLVLALFRQGVPLWLLVPVAVIFGFAAGGWAGLTLAQVSEFAGSELTGMAAALAAVFGMVGNIVGPPVFGYIVDSTGSYRLAWGSMAGVAVVAAVFVLFIRESRRKI
jgi:ACS family hexuronate transporter-like MFS transporter